MNIQLHVRIDGHMLLRSARVIGPLAVIGAAGVALADVPNTFAPGETLTAAHLNENFSDLDARIEAVHADLPVLSDWEPYDVEVVQGAPPGVPVPTEPFASATSTGFWRRVGDTLEVSIVTVFPSCSSSEQLRWSLPAGLVPDTSKMSGAYPIIGTITAVNYANGTVINANAVASGALPQVALQQATGQPGGCALVGNGGDARLKFAIPIDGWSMTN